MEDVPIEKKLPPEEMVETLLRQAEKPVDFGDAISMGARQRRRLGWLRDRAIVHCLYSSGARVSELMNLKRDDLQYENQGAWATKTKGHKTRFIRFSDKAWRFLMDYLEARDDLGLVNRYPVFCRHDRGAGSKRIKLSTLSVERMIKRLLEEADVNHEFNLTPHSLRHFFATRFLQETGNLALTQDALGHSDPNTTRVYAKTSKSDLIKAHKNLFK